MVLGTSVANNHAKSVVSGTSEAHNHANSVASGMPEAPNHANSVVSCISEARNHANDMVSGTSEDPGLFWDLLSSLLTSQLAPARPATHNRLLDPSPRVEGLEAVAMPLQSRRKAKPLAQRCQITLNSMHMYIHTYTHTLHKCTHTFTHRLPFSCASGLSFIGGSSWNLRLVDFHFST